MSIEYHRRFVKTYHKLPLKLQKAVDDKIRLFSKNPFASELNNHALKGGYKEYRSINITGDFRVIYQELSKEAVIFVFLGTHAQLYGA